VLDHGALPLPVLEQAIAAWIARTKAGATPISLPQAPATTGP
jgi:hypothetical protein